MGTTLTSLPEPIANSDHYMPPPAKKARLEHTTLQDARVVNRNSSRQPTTPKRQQESFQTAKPRPLGRQTRPPRWEGLPYVALVEIFRRLSNADKYNAALTCRSWMLPFSRPALWRRGNFRFNGVDDWRALCFASMMGSALRHVTIDCSIQPESRPFKASLSVENLVVFLTSLVNCNNSQVVTFRLTGLRRLVKHLPREGNDIIHLLTRFLARQETLTLLDLENSGLPLDTAFQIMTAVADAAGDRVHLLSISDVICPVTGLGVATDPRLLSTLVRFTVLSELSLSHRYLSDDLLFLLASTLAKTLTQISVLATNLRVSTGETSPDAWRYLKHRCRGLQAIYTLKGVSHDMSLRDILTPGIPLKHLHWNSGSFTTMINTKSCFDHIITHFNDVLQHLVLDLHFAFFDDEDDLVALIDRCLRLETLTLTSSLVLPPRRFLLERAVRRAVGRQPRSRLIGVTINGESVSLRETWATSIVGWLVKQVQ